MISTIMDYIDTSLLPWMLTDGATAMMIWLIGYFFTLGSALALYINDIQNKDVDIKIENFLVYTAIWSVTLLAFWPFLLGLMIFHKDIQSE